MTIAEESPARAQWGRVSTRENQVFGLAKLRDALCGPRAPGEEHDASAETGLLTKIGATVTVDDFDDSVRELLPALALVRTGGASAHGQAGVEHQHAALGPRREVPVLWGDEVRIFGLDFRINLRRAHHEMSDSCHRKEGWRMGGGGGGGGGRMGRTKGGLHSSARVA